jgi:hypothetical protein
MPEPRAPRGLRAWPATARRSDGTDGDVQRDREGRPRPPQWPGVTAKALALVREVVESCSGLSRTELARTVCELLGWKRAAGGLKAQECREFLERLEAAGALALPDKQPRRPVGSRPHVPVTTTRLSPPPWGPTSRPHVPVTTLGERGRALVGDVVDDAPI